MKNDSTRPHLTLVPRKPQRRQRQLTFDNRDGNATADRFNHSVIVPFCSVECKPAVMDDCARALGGLSVNARRVYHKVIALSGMGKNVIHRLRVGEIAAGVHISESSALRALKELKRAKFKFIEEAELDADGNGKLYFECSEPGHRHGDSSMHYISPGDRPVQVRLHPLHESRKCACYSGGSRKGRKCKVPNWYFSLGGVGAWVAELALYQSGFGGIGIPSFAPRKHIVEHVMVGYSEDRVGRVLEELLRLGAKRTKQYYRGVQVASIFQLPANPPEGIVTVRDDCATPARVSLRAVRMQSACNLHESQTPIRSVTDARLVSHRRPSGQSQTPMLIDSLIDTRSDTISDGSVSPTDGSISVSVSNADTAMAMEQQEMAVLLDALVSLGTRFVPKPERGEGAFTFYIPPGALTPDLDRAMVRAKTPRHRDELRRLVAERGLCG
jgi:hypothetical protein